MSAPKPDSVVSTRKSQHVLSQALANIQGVEHAEDVKVTQWEEGSSTH